MIITRHDSLKTFFMTQVTIFYLLLFVLNGILQKIGFYFTKIDKVFKLEKIAENSLN